MENNENANANHEESILETSEEMQHEQPEVRNFEAELDVLKDQLLRAVAETENVRKRGEKQIEDMRAYAISGFSKDLINVMENLCRTLDNISPDKLEEHPLLKTLHEGVEMTRKELTSIFERHNIKRINPAIGDMFDHNLHQAVMHVEDTGHPSGSVVQVLQAGYSLNQRLLTAAMVGVAK